MHKVSRNIVEFCGEGVIMMEATLHREFGTRDNSACIYGICDGSLSLAWQKWLAGFVDIMHYLGRADLLHVFKRRLLYERMFFC